MIDVNFGLPSPWNGTAGFASPAVAMNNSQAMAIYENGTNNIVGCTGTVYETYILWRQRMSMFVTPIGSMAVALNNANYFVVAYQAKNGTGLYYTLGQVTPPNFPINQLQQPVVSAAPSVSSVSVAMNNNSSNNVLVAYTASGSLYYCLGSMSSGSAISWGAPVNYAAGSNCAIAFNDAGAVVEVHQSGNALKCREGQIVASGIAWGNFGQDSLLFTIPSIPSGSAIVAPSVAINNSGFAIVTFGIPTRIYKTTGGSEPYAVQLMKLYSATGTLSISTQPNCYAVTEHVPVSQGIACNNQTAIQLQQLTVPGANLMYSCSLITDRSQWMKTLSNDQSLAFGSQTLKNIALPMSHDSGMYLGDTSKYTQTQSQTISQQLAGGIRCFDLRVRLDGSVFNIHHGPYSGPLFQDVLNDIAAFMGQPGCRELVILIFSDFTKVTRPPYEVLPQADYNNYFVPQITNTLGPYLVNPKPINGLTNTSLSQIVSNGGRAIVVCDGAYAMNHAVPGIYVYRELKCGSGNTTNQGDLVVAGHWSDTDSCQNMRDDQLNTFNNYTGGCANDGPTSDLFQVKWTLTPGARSVPIGIGVIELSSEANPLLVPSLVRYPTPGSLPQGWIPLAAPVNQYGRGINLVEVDNYQTSRVTDLCIGFNRLNSTMTKTPNRPR